MERGWQSARDSVALLGNINILIPAFVFAGTAIAVGLIISLFLGMWLTSFISTTSQQIPVNINIKFDALTTWLLTCLGGMHIKFSIPLIGSLSCSFSAKIVLFLFVPIVSLFIARKVRYAFISSKYPGKELQMIDGAAGALLFALINAMLSFMPSSIESSINDLIRSLTALVAGGFGINSGFSLLNLKVSSSALNVFWVSFVIAFLFSMPDIRTLGKRFGFIGSSLTISLYHTMHMLSAGFCVAVFLFISGKITFFVLPNIAIWVMSILSGGIFNIITKIPPQTAAIWLLNEITAESISGFSSGIMGTALLIIGLFIVVISLYPAFRQEQGIIKKGVAVSLFSTVMVWIIASFATLSLSIETQASNLIIGANENFSGEFSASTASIGAFAGTAAVFAIAVALINFIRNIPVLDNALVAISSHKGSMLATALLCVLAAVLLNNISEIAHIERSLTNNLNLLK